MGECAFLLNSFVLLLLIQDPHSLRTALKRASLLTVRFRSRSAVLEPRTSFLSLAIGHFFMQVSVDSPEMYLLAISNLAESTQNSMTNIYALATQPHCILIFFLLAPA